MKKITFIKHSFLSIGKKYQDLFSKDRLFLLLFMIVSSSMLGQNITQFNVDGAWNGNDANGNAIVKWRIQVCVDGPTEPGMGVEVYAPTNSDGGGDGGGDEVAGTANVEGDDHSPAATNCGATQWSGGPISGGGAGRMNPKNTNTGQITPNGGLNFTAAGCTNLRWTHYSKDYDSSADDENHYVVAETCIGCGGAGLSFDCTGADSNGNIGCTNFNNPGSGNCANMIDCDDVNTNNYEQILGLSVGLHEVIRHKEGYVEVVIVHVACHHGESDYVAGRELTAPFGTNGDFDVMPADIKNIEILSPEFSRFAGGGTLDSVRIENPNIQMLQPHPNFAPFGATIPYSTTTPTNQPITDVNTSVLSVHGEVNGVGDMPNNSNGVDEAGCGSFEEVCDTLYVHAFWTPGANWNGECNQNIQTRASNYCPGLAIDDATTGVQQPGGHPNTPPTEVSDNINTDSAGNPDDENGDCSDNITNTCGAASGDDCDGENVAVCVTEPMLTLDKNIISVQEDLTDPDFYIVEFEIFACNDASSDFILENVDLEDPLVNCLPGSEVQMGTVMVDPTVIPSNCVANNGFPMPNAGYDGDGDVNLTDGLGAIDPGECYRVTFIARVPYQSLNAGNDENKANATANDITGIFNNITADASVAIPLPNPDLALTKSTTQTTPVLPGDDVTFTIEVENQGDLAMDSVKINDYIPAGFTFNAGLSPMGWMAMGDTIMIVLSGTDLDGDSRLDAGDVASVDIVLTVNAGFVAEDYINIAEISEMWDTLGIPRGPQDIDSTPDGDPTNDAGGGIGTGADFEMGDFSMGDASGGPGDGNAAGDEDDADPATVPIFDLALTKTVDPVSLAAVGGMIDEGETFTYFVTVVNQGNIDADNIVIQDTFPCGLEYVASTGWTLSGSGGSAEYTIPTLAAGASEAVPIMFTVKNSADVTTDCMANMTVVAGQPFTNFAQVISADNDNDPNTPAPNDIDSNPNSNTPEEYATMPNQMGDNDVDSPGNGGVGSEDDSDPANIEVFDLALTKVLNPVALPYKDGDIATFDICVTNQGNISTDSIIISDYIPDGYSWSMTNEPDWSFDGTSTATTSIVVADMPGGTLDFLEQVCVSIDLVVEGGGTDYVNIGEISGATTLTDDGMGGTTTSFVMSDNDSDFDTDSGNDAGGTVDTDEDNHIGDDAMDSNGDGITDEDDADPANVPLVDFALNKSIVSTQATPYGIGDTISFVIEVTNQGNVPGANFTINDYVPSHLEFEPTLNPGWTPASTASSVTVMMMHAPVINPGETDTVEINLIVLSGGLDQASYTNHSEIGAVFAAQGGPVQPGGAITPGANITSFDVDSTPDAIAGNDPGADNNSADSGQNPNPADGAIDGDGTGTANEPGDMGDPALDEDDADPAYVAIHDMALTKVLDPAQGPASVGEDVTFQITIYNQGNSPVDSVKITDYVAEGYTFADNNDWVAAGANACLTATVTNGLLPAGGLLPQGELTFPIVLTVNGNAMIGDTASILNIAEISGSRDLNGLTDADDADSNADSDPTNDPGGLVGSGSDDVNMGNGEEGGGMPGDTDPLTDEDDADPAIIELLPHSIGNQVWEDTNNNGVIDGDEMGVEGVEVVLHYYNPETMMCEIVDTLYTDMDGLYLFDSLVNGQYIVEITADNFVMGGPLFNTASSTNNGADISSGPDEDDLAAIDPDDDVDSDDNGVFDGNAMFPGAVVSDTLDLGMMEPTGEDPNNDMSGAADDNSNLTVDFGFVPLHSVGNQVWVDLDNDGVIDMDEVGAEGVEVILHYFNPETMMCEIVDTLYTDMDGLYLFDSLIAGDYIVELGADNFASGGPFEGYVSTTGSGTDVASGPFEDDLAAIDPDNDVDNDDNGVFDGNAMFPGAIVSDTLTLGGVDPEPTGEDPDNDPLTTDENENLTVDFGIVPLHSLGNQVWTDSNNNRILDDGEEPIEGVEVVLHYYNPTTMMCDILGTTTTDADGLYLFDSLIAGDYLVEITAANFDAGGPLEGTTSSTGSGAEDLSNGPNEVPTMAVDVDGNPTDGDDNGVLNGNGDPMFDGSVVSDTISLGFGEPEMEDPDNDTFTPDDRENLTVDFGFVPLHSVGNQVWYDLNNNGLIDEGEEPIEGVAVELHYVDPLANGTCVLIETVLTDMDGLYLFDSLVAGDYVVVLSASNFDVGGPLENYVSSTGNGPTDLATGPYEDDLAAIDPDDNIDADDNGVYDGNAMFPGAVASDTLTLGGDPESLMEDPDNDESGALDENSNLTVDFGFVKLHSIGNQVWEDLNNNGILDDGEDPIEGVEVVLHYADPITGECIIVETLTTDADGLYLFDSLGAGDYIVELTAANFEPGGPFENYVSSTGNGPIVPGSGLYEDPTMQIDPDNDVNLDDNGVLNGNGSPMFAGSIVSDTLSLGEMEPTLEGDDPLDTDNDESAAADDNSNLTVDFGLVPLHSVGNQVWTDLNNNGVIDGDEEPIEGVEVVLHYVDPVTGLCVAVDTQYTDAMGLYLFDSLIAGDYIVEITPENFEEGGALEGTISSTGGGTTTDSGPYEDDLTAIDPDDNTDSDDNGVYGGNAMFPGSVVSDTLSLGDMEPLDEDPDNDTSTALDMNSNLTVDFGFVPMYSVGNQVWFDENDNGLIDEMEMGIEGVTVELHWYNPTTMMCEVIATTMTDMDGLYLFDSLVAGQYIVMIPDTDLGPGGVLQDFQSTTGTFNMGGPYEDTGNPIDGDSDIDNDDNGVLGLNPNFPTYVASDTLTLGGDPEPTGEDPDNDDYTLDTNENLALDFGFVDKVYDMALTKQYTNPEEIYVFGEEIPMNIEIINQGNTPLTNIEIKEYIPATLTTTGVTSPNTGWTFMGDMGTYTYTDVLMPNMRDTIELSLIFQPSALIEDYINYAEVASFEDELGNTTVDGSGPYGDPLEDIDSAADAMNGNDQGGIPDGDTDDFIDGVAIDEDGNPTGMVGEDDPATDEDDHDPLMLGFVDMAIQKTLVTEGPVQVGQDVEFEIIVFNQGTFEMFNIDVIDYIPEGFELNDAAWTPAGDNATITLDGSLKFEESDTISITLTVLPDAQADNLVNRTELTDFEFEFGDSAVEFDIDSEADDIVDNDPGGNEYGDSDNALDGDGLNGGGAPGDNDPLTDEDDADPAVPQVLDLALIKTIDPLTSAVRPGDIVTFTIEVCNQGNILVDDILITDYIPEGLLLADGDWTSVDANTATYNLIGDIDRDECVSVDIDLEVQAMFTAADMINVAEITTVFGPGDMGPIDYTDSDIDSTPNDDTGEAASTLGGADDNSTEGQVPAGEDSDDADPAAPPVMDLAIQKTNPVEGPSMRGDIIPFEIRVINQGNMVARDILVTDYIPEGLEATADNTGWTVTAPTASYTVGELQPDADTIIVINLEILQTATPMNVVNMAEVSGAVDTLGVVYTGDGDDYDSDFDADNTNDVGNEIYDFENNDELDDHGIAHGADGIDDEDDHDQAWALLCDGMACIGDINLSLDETCTGMIVPTMLLSGDLFPDHVYTIVVMDEDGNEVPNDFGTENVGETYEVSIFNPLCENNTCWMNVDVEYKFPPVIDCVDTIIISCAASVDPNLGMPTASSTGNCADVTVLKVSDVPDYFTCDEEYVGKVTKQWVAIDEYGNISDTCTTVILLERTNTDSINFPTHQMLANNMAVSCSSNYAVDSNGNPAPSVTGVPKLEVTAGVFVDLYPFEAGVICNGYVTYSDKDILGANTCVRKIKRTWTVGEWHCTNPDPVTYTQYIEIVDNEGPTFSSVGDMSFSTGSFSCSAVVSFPIPTMTDACNPDGLTMDLGTPAGFFENYAGELVELTTGVHDIIYTASDICGFITVDTIQVTVSDNADPIAVCDQFTVASIGLDGLSFVTAETIDDGSFDECGEVTLAVARMDDPGFDDLTGFSDQIEVSCTDIGSPLMVGLLVTDKGGNTNMCMVQVEVQDKVDAKMTCVDNVTVPCNFPYDPDNLAAFFGAVDIFDNCPATNTLDDQIIAGSLNTCGAGVLTRRIRLLNSAGVQTDVCTQIITFENGDPLAEGDIEWPDAELPFTGCIEDITNTADLGEPFVADVECQQVGMRYEDEIFPFNSNGTCQKVIRTWYVIDWCLPQDELGGVLNPFSFEQTIKVNNTIAPSFTSVPQDTVICSYAADCASLQLDGYLIATATDDCTEDDDLLALYEVRDEVGTVVQSGSGLDASGTYQIGVYDVLYTVEDKCGNPTTTSVTFEIRNCKLPTPYCLNGLSAGLVAMDLNDDGDIDTEMIMLTPDYFDGGSYHTCGYDVQLSFSSDVNDTELMFDCDDIGVNEVELWVTDENGNQDFCITYIDVQDNNDIEFCDPLANRVDVQGRIFTAEDEELSGVTIVLEGGEIADELTEDDGAYMFGDMPLGGDYTVNPGKNDDHRNGVNTIDLVKIQRHLLGVELLDSPYKIIAADINNDGKIRAADLLSLRKLILGVADDFPNNESWRFVSDVYTFADPTDPLSENFVEAYEIEDLASNMWVDFVALKVGDVNDDVVTNPLTQKTTESRSASTMSLSLDDATLVADQTTDIPVYANTDGEIYGLQVAMTAADIAVIDIIPAKLNMKLSSTAQISDELRISHAEQNGVTVTAGDLLFVMKVRVEETVAASDVIAISEDFLSAEAYLGTELETADVEMTWIANDEEELPSIGSLSIGQNTPNPWKGQTTIEVSAPTAGDVTFRVTDTQGRLIYTNTTYFDEGRNTISISSEDVPQTGVLLYEVQLGSEVAKGKMIHIE